MASRDIILILLQIGIVVLAGIGGYYAFVLRISQRVTSMEGRCEAHVETLQRVHAMSDEVQRMKADNAVFWRVIEPHLGNIIHSPKAQKRDSLVDKLIAGTIDPKEARDLVETLDTAIRTNGWPPEKVLAGALLLARASVIAEKDRS